MKEVMRWGERRLRVFFVLLVFGVAAFASANTYLSDIYFSTTDGVYSTGERIELKGYVYQANYTDAGVLVSSAAALSGALVNFSILYPNGSVYTNGSALSNYTFTTDANGAFYSRSDYYTAAVNVTAPLTANTYTLRAEYRDLNNNLSVSGVEISVVNESIDTLRVRTDKASYNPSETVLAEIEAVRSVGDSVVYVANVSINGSLLNGSKYSLQSFNCTTGTNGKCTVSLTAPTTYGDYFVEVGNFKTFSSFSVVPFSFIVFMKDDLGSFKNIFALGEKASVEVNILNASSSDSYTFSGYIADAAGSSVKSISSTTLNSTNSFKNSFVFTVDSITFSYGTYLAYLTVSKSGDGSISSTASFQVQDWMLSLSKKSSGSGFEYEYSAFPNKTLRFEALPSYRTNGSIIQNVSSSSFSILLKDSLHNIITSSNVTWNSTCGSSGCYEFNITSPTIVGKYILSTTLSYSGDSQTETKVINVISGVMSAQSTDKDGSLKELFGTNEYVYLSLSAYNQTSNGFNLSDAEVFVVSFMNGTEFNYTQVSNFSAVNASTNASEWAWNATLQRIKLDVPKAGGVYTVFLFGNNRTLGAQTRFIVNPFDSCISAKNTPGTVSSGYYYVWQFKTSDTIYFEIKLTQANNPLGRASAANATNSSTFGMGSACTIDTATKQVVSNATISVVNVKNLESGASQGINVTDTVCQASDSSGAYSCTVKPYSKWAGGVNIVAFNVVGQDGSSAVLYSNFESRAFYLYGYSSNWQNSPDSTVTLNLQLYEAGTNWWSTSGGSGGISGTVAVKRVEYMGRNGEWQWPPVDYGYNLTNVSSSTITSGTGSISLPPSNAPGGSWKTGNYRVVLQATKTATGETDYGYAWFSVKLWDVYGSPVECLSTGCSYKSYFNSKENITLFVKISKAGGYNYNYAGGEGIYGNVTVKVKKIEECKSWPCKELNSTYYTAGSINVNASSSWYWNADSVNESKYLLQINRTLGTWNTGWYNVVLDVNGTDTGYAWFNAIAFYVDVQPTNVSGSAWKYTIRGSQPMYFNVTTTKSYKWNSYGGVRYNSSDYINATIDSAVLRLWDYQTQKSREFTYPSSFNISSNITGNTLINLTYNNGSWPTGYYWGELTLKNSDNESSTGWMWFSVQPFRVSVSSTSYNIDSDQCVNSSLVIYDSDWSTSTPLSGNYSITSVYEDIWGGSSNSRVTYTNYTSSSFKDSLNTTICPNDGQWSSGNWGGYHSLNVVVKDNAVNDSQTGWLSFKTVPFLVSWIPSSLGSTRTNANINVIVNLNKSNGTATTGNLTQVYQWRYDNYQSTREEYRFTVNSSGVFCDSASSSQCTVNRTANVTIYAPSNGWKVGYNYLQAFWAKESDATAKVEDWSGIYFEGRELYNGYFTNSNASDSWKYDFAQNENITIKLTVQNSDYTAASSLSITSVQYALSQNCWTEACRVYSAASYSPTTTNASGVAILQLAVPSTNWTKGTYAIKAVVGGITVTGGTVRVKDFTVPNITLSVPVNNATYGTTLSFSASTVKSATCSLSVVNYDNFYNWYCGGWNSSNGTITAQTVGACNSTNYLYNGSLYISEYISSTYHSYYDGVNSSYCYLSGSSSTCYGPHTTRTGTYVSTGGTSHSYTLNLTGLPTQHYGAYTSCYDEDYNNAQVLAAFKVNNSA